DHSLPYCTAVALVDGDVTLAQFDPGRFGDPALLDLVAKVHGHRDSALSARYPAGIPNRVPVNLQDASKHTCAVEFRLGHARNPRTDAEVEHKFRTLVQPRYGKEIADRVLAACWGLDKLSSAGELVRLLNKK